MKDKQSKEEIYQEWRTVRTKAISEMFDNVNSSGIYPTSIFFDTIDEFFKESLDRYASQFTAGSSELKDYVVIADDDKIEIWTKSQYDIYVHKAVEHGACPTVKLLTTFNFSDSLLDTTFTAGNAVSEGKNIAVDYIDRPVEIIYEQPSQTNVSSDEDIEKMADKYAREFWNRNTYGCAVISFKAGYKAISKPVLSDEEVEKIFIVNASEENGRRIMNKYDFIRAIKQFKAAISKGGAIEKVEIDVVDGTICVNIHKDGKIITYFKEYKGGARWVNVEDAPLFTVDEKGNWTCTEAGDKEFWAAVPYEDKRQPDKKLWWIRHCIIEDRIGLCVVGDDDNEPAGWDMKDIEFYMLLPKPPLHRKQS